MLKVANCQPALSIVLSALAAPYTVILYATVHLCEHIYSPCGASVPTTDVGWDGVAEGAHPPKCIFAVLLSLVNVVVMTTTAKLYLVPH